MKKNNSNIKSKINTVTSNLETVSYKLFKYKSKRKKDLVLHDIYCSLESELESLEYKLTAK